MWFGAIVGMVIIFVFWLWSLSVLFSQSSKNENENSKPSQGLSELKKEIPGLWQSLSAGVSNVISTAKEDLKNNDAATPSASPEEQQVEMLPIEE